MSSEVVTQNDMSKVDGLFIPLHEKQLILPNVTVAEIIPYRAPTPAINSESWLLGTLEWRNIEIPVVCYEALNGQEIPPIEGARFAVLNGTSAKQELPFYAVLIQGIPKLTHIHEEDVVAVDAMHSGPFDEMAVSLFGEQAMIPDLGKMEKELLKHVG